LKIEDLRNESSLHALGWHVVTIWECALKKKSDHPWLVARLQALLAK
jgi:G:T-mismatch repair DNA endonuclease (very short patch repair protein)